jgi:hypothetical protein
VTLTTSVKAAFLGFGSFSSLNATSYSASRPLSNLKPKPQRHAEHRGFSDLIHKLTVLFPSLSEYAQTRIQAGIKKATLVTRFPEYFSAQLCPQMLLSDCQPFAWYFVVTCSDCRIRQAMFQDPSDGKAAIRRTYKHTCDKCGLEAFYEPEEVERYRHIVERRKKPRD